MLSIRDLRKSFSRVVAVDGISFDVRRGELFGLLGPNGAGKTTTIRTVLDIIKPDSGVITFDGQPFSQEMWNQIGYLPEERGLYKKSKVISAIFYFAALKGMTEAEAKPRAAQWLERFALADAAHRRVEELSKGNQQKVQLITSLIHSPQLLVLDEPFSGLDPVNQILLKDILQDLRKQNIAIVFSTHQMEQVEKLCDEIILINKGRAVVQGRIRDVKKAHGSNTVHLEFEGDGSFLRSIDHVTRAEVYPNEAELELSDPAQSQTILQAASARLRVKRFEVLEPSLESIFVSSVGGRETLEKAAAQKIEAAVPRRSVAGDQDVKKALRGVIIALVLAAFFIGKGFVDGHLEPSMIALWAAVFAFTGFRYVQARKKAEQSAAGGNP
ncbi:MAG: ATP-binding cassette domain-containing protein [Bacteroidetes bacterium]|jgi:ABC-2 type transport system ATP-binding protein|nr:ATP-binding cassette domain-containing protein [Bacteroidota bacterium]